MNRQAYAIASASLALLLTSCTEPAKPTPNDNADGGLDFNRLIESLVNNNPEPEMVRPQLFWKPLFSDNYNWSELTRVKQASDVLTENAERAWPLLVEHDTDERYSMTIHHVFSADMSLNLSVGDVCRRIIRLHLQDSWLGAFDDSGEFVWREWQRNAFGIPPNPAPELHAWCSARSDKRLYELQIDTLEAAIGVVEGLTMPSAEAKEKDVARIKQQIELLRTSRQAHRPNRLSVLVHEAEWLYTENDAKERERIRSDEAQHKRDDE